MKNQFKSIIHSLIETKKKLFAQSLRVDELMNEIRSILNSQQVGSFLLWLETVSISLLKN